MSADGLVVPRCSVWSEDTLASLSAEAFCQALHDRAVAIGRDVYDAAAYELVEVAAPEKHERVVFYLRRRAWAEWYFGVETPARQLTMLPATEVDLKQRLARQIVDEMRHHRVFSREVRRRGGEWRLTRFQPPPHLLRMLETQTGNASPYELAAANQYSGEIVLEETSRTGGNILRSLVDDEVMAAVEDIETDEPAHVALGRALVLRHALHLERRRGLALAQERFLDALVAQHAQELQLLGCRRLRPLPRFAARAGAPA